MARVHRLSFLIVPVALGVFWSASPVRAQETQGVRYAFADTTLLRDTLGLRFPRLFPLSDSLQVLPDTLRALSIRYLWTLERLVHLADSLSVPVDSVGPVMERERFNPLASGAGPRKDFTYNSSYSVGQTQSAWRNAADYSFQTGPIFVRNSTTVEMNRYRVGTLTSLRQTRSASTELGWKLSPDLSVGGRVNLDRLDTRDPSSNANIGETTNQYQLSMRSRQKPLRGLSSEINLFSGLFDLANSSLEKRGLSGDLTSRIRYSAGTWLTQELNGTVNGIAARSHKPNTVTRQSTRDLSTNLRATLSLFPSSVLGLKSNVSLRHVQTETPADSVSTQRVLTDNSTAEATVRLRQDNDRYLDVSERAALAKQATVIGASSRSTRRDNGFSANGRYTAWGLALEGRFQNGFSNSSYPTRSDSGGYTEFVHSRSVEGNLSRQLAARLLAKASASISLTSSRYRVIGRYPSPPVDRDQWRQFWRVEGNYTASTKLNTAVVLDVSKSRLIYLPGARSGANTDVRSYRAEWRWSYRLLPSLTATQRNSLTADYTDYTFSSANDRLLLEYGVLTTLNAVISPRLTINMTHNGRQQPGGSYTPGPDGLSYFARSDENENYSLAASVIYSPSPALSLTFDPTYAATDRLAAVNGVDVPQRTTRSLNFSGGANINWPIGNQGSLRGDIRRSFRGQRVTTLAAGVPLPQRSEEDFWNGSLQLSWRL